MRSFPAVPLITALCLSIGAPRAFGDGFSLFSQTWGNVIVATDFTPEGKAIPPPTPENPAYYVGTSLGCRLGSIPGDRHPEAEEMSRIVAKVLARQGYLGTRPELREPSLFIVLQWGYIRPSSGDLVWFLGYDARNDIAASPNPGMPGLEVYWRNMRSREIDTILDYADEPVYGIIVTAFEYKSARTANPILYWQTRIGLPANGKSMAQALPTMVIAAGSAIGRESDGPILRSADNARSGRVDLGELEVLGYEDEAERRN